MKRLICSVLASLSLMSLSAQRNAGNAYTTRAFAGVSAISVDSIAQKTIHLNFPTYDYKSDTLNQQIIYSVRQRGDGDDVFLNKGGFGAISYIGDSVKWVNETALYDIALTPRKLIVSSISKSVRFHRRFGFDLFRFPARVNYITRDGNYGFLYTSAESDNLACIELDSGKVKYNLDIPSRDNWNDVRMQGDSVLLIAASGLHGIKLRTGETWHLPLKTAVTNTGTLEQALAKYESILDIGDFHLVSHAENLITDLSSNIFIGDSLLYYCCAEKLIACDFNGRVVWELMLSEFPVSKTLLTMYESKLLLVNFGVARFGKNPVIYGKPFMLVIDPSTGELQERREIGSISNLADFSYEKGVLRFAGKEDILEMSPGAEVQNLKIPLNVIKYGKFVRFINSDQYYTNKEGYFIPLSLINDKIIYFLADNNKIYGIDGDQLIYEYHFTDLFRRHERIGNKLVLKGLSGTLITNSNFELLATLFRSEPHLSLKNKLYFFDREKIHIFDLDAIRVD